MIQLDSSSDYINLCAITRSNEVINISNQVLRKTLSREHQETLNDNSICIVSNYKFLENKLEWSPKIKAICHPFRDASIFPQDRKLSLLSESDFVDKLWVRVEKKRREKRYSFIYFTFFNRQGIKCKGLFYLPFFVNYTQKMDLRGLVVDYQAEDKPFKQYSEQRRRGSSAQALRKTRKHIAKCKNLKILTKQSSSMISKMMQRSNFLFVPNTADASPRVITEALIRGIPIIINRKIYGGWKYLNQYNGISYLSPMNKDDMDKNWMRYKRRAIRVVAHMANKRHDPKDIRNSYYKDYGLLNTSRRLASIINEIEEKEKYEYVFYPQFAEVFLENLKGLTDKREVV